MNMAGPLATHTAASLFAVVWSSHRRWLTNRKNRAKHSDESPDRLACCSSREPEPDAQDPPAIELHSMQFEDEMQVHPNPTLAKSDEKIPLSPRIVKLKEDIDQQGRSGQERRSFQKSDRGFTVPQASPDEKSNRTLSGGALSARDEVDFEVEDSEEGDYSSDAASDINDVIADYAPSDAPPQAQHTARDEPTNFSFKSPRASTNRSPRASMNHSPQASTNRSKPDATVSLSQLKDAAKKRNVDWEAIQQRHATERQQLRNHKPPEQLTQRTTSTEKPSNPSTSHPEIEKVVFL